MDKKDRIKFLKEKIADKKLQIETLKKEADIFNSMQLAFKLILNGSYGAFANKHFVCFCNGVAATITAHGRDLIQIMDKAGNHYFKKKWHLDKEAHEKMGITGEVKPIPEDVECCVYVDTDSNFFTFKPAIDSCGWSGDPLKFVHLLCEHRLTDYFKKVLEAYASKYNTTNVHNFELEQVSESIIFLEKKMYIKNVRWEDGSPNETNPEWCKKGTFYESISELQAKGIDLVRSSSAKFTREKVKDVIIKYYFKNPNTFNDRELVRILRDLKEQFKASNIEDISRSSSCNKYDVMVLNDQNKLEFQDKTHHAVKAAALHNYLLNQNPKYKTKYNLIKNGSKVKYYCTKSPLNDEFAYVQGIYPIEIATTQAQIDYDRQFEKCILNIVNRFNAVLGLSQFDSKLTFTLSLF